MSDESTRWDGIVGYDAAYRQSDALSLRPSGDYLLNFVKNTSVGVFDWFLGS